MLSLIFAATAFCNVSIFDSLRPFSAASFQSGRTLSCWGLFFSAFPQSSTFTCTPISSSYFFPQSSWTNHHSQSFSSAQQAHNYHHCSCQLQVHLRSASPLLRNLRLCSGSHLRLTHCQGPAVEAEHAKGLLSPPG